SLSYNYYADTPFYTLSLHDALTISPFDPAHAVDGYTDNCLGTVTATLTATNVTGTDCNWTVTYTYTVKDVCGNALPGQTYFNTDIDKADVCLPVTLDSRMPSTNSCK